MSVWLVRAGKSGERENYALEHGAVVIGWPGMGDMTGIATREEMLARMQEAHDGAKLNTVRNWTSQVWPFVKEIKAGDTIALPLKGRPAVMFGKAKGGYRYVADAPVEARNQIPVEWGVEVPRGAIPQDVLYSLGAFMTVCRIWRNDAETRIAALIAGKPVAVTASPVPEEDEAGGETIDLEETARNAISAAIYARYKGHGLERVVAAVLEAQGYKTRVSPEGADGGVDVVAGSGPLGLDSPRLVVQVKSEQSPVDVRPVRELHGVMREFGADHGLMVAWGGFKGSVLKETMRKFFEVRLWTGDDLVQAILDHYDALPADMRAELPLKRIWTLVPEGE